MVRNDSNTTCSKSYVLSYNLVLECTRVKLLVKFFSICNLLKTYVQKFEFMEKSTKTMPWVATHPWPVQNRAKMHWIVSINSLHNWMKLLEVVEKCSPWCIYSRANQCNDLRTLLDYLLSRRSVLGAYWNVPTRQCTVMFFPWKLS